jgi:hypothetical protein
MSPRNSRNFRYIATEHNCHTKHDGILEPSSSKSVLLLDNCVKPLSFSKLSTSSFDPFGLMLDGQPCGIMRASATVWKIDDGVGVGYLSAHEMMACFKSADHCSLDGNFPEPTRRSVQLPNDIGRASFSFCPPPCPSFARALPSL